MYHRDLVTVLNSGRICAVLQVEPRTKRPVRSSASSVELPRRGAAAYGVACSAPMTARSTLLEVKSAPYMSCAGFKKSPIELRRCPLDVSTPQMCGARQFAVRVTVLQCYKLLPACLSGLRPPSMQTKHSINRRQPPTYETRLGPRRRVSRHTEGPAGASTNPHLRQRVSWVAS